MKPNRPKEGFTYATTEKIYWAYLHQQAIGIVNYGEWGVGKSVFAIKVLKELYPGDEWKRWVLFKPEDVLDRLTEISLSGERVPAIVWDDAGLYLYALDWNDPRVKSVVKFLNVLRTMTASIIMTAPAVEMIVTKIPRIEGMRICKTTKPHGTGNKDMRLFQAYRNNIMPWGKRYVRSDWEDPFNIMLSEEDYAWYQPLRNRYAKEAVSMMREAWLGHKSKDNIGTKEAQIEALEAKIGA